MLPWPGRRQGSTAQRLVRNSAALLKRRRFEVQPILGGGQITHLRLLENSFAVAAISAGTPVPPA